MRDLNLRRDLAATGIIFPDTAITTADPAKWQAWARDLTIAADENPDEFQMVLAGLGADAQPQLVTATSAGIPYALTNFIDPQVIRVLTQPMRAVQILGEAKKGDWTTLSAQFMIAEAAGNVSSYGDFNNNGTVDANFALTARQSFHYQTIERWGERMAAFWGLASINYKAQLDMSAALVMGKFQNRSYFYGISGLQNYGLLNDPSIPAAITPATKTGGGTTWVTATAAEIYADVLALFGQLQTQMGYNIDMSDPIRLVLSNNRVPLLAKVSAFNVTAKQTILENFPNMTIETAPEYSTGGGELMQMILPSYEGVETGYGAFTEKMRAHPLVVQLSAFMQKLSGGTWGAIIRRPNAIAQMLGI